MPSQTTEFSRWLHGYLRAQTLAEPTSDVPCGECNACCKSSFYIQIDSAERETLALIPASRLTRSTEAKEPQWTLDQSNAGSCPMLIDGACSIYAQRPRTCRRFDCRVFVATGLGVGAGPRAALNERVWQWRFHYPSERDAAYQSAVLAAVAFLQRCADLIHPDVAPLDTGSLAKAAVLVYELFLEPNAAPDTELAAAISDKLRSCQNQASPRIHMP
jgi:uncharacterized protein